MSVLQVMVAGCLVMQASAGSIGKASPAAAGFSSERLARITDYFNHEVSTGKIPGAIVLIQRKGQQFISRAHGRFYGGIEESTDWTGAAQQSNDSPVTFAFPGQPGFGVARICP